MEELLKLYKDIDEVITKHIVFNLESMRETQKLGYNGFKRMHKCNSKELFCYHQDVVNNYYDNCRETLDVSIPVNQGYAINNMKEHLEMWNNLLETSLKSLATANKKHIELVGVSNCIIECVIKQFCHDYEKVGRWYKRFVETNWLAHDMHVLDDRLHDKIKKEEYSGE